MRSLLPADLVSTYIPDVQVLLDSAPVADDPLPGDGGDDDDVWNVTTLASPFHDGYHTLDQVYQFGEALVSHFNIVTSYDIGTTAEGRPIRAWSAKIDEEATPGIPEDGGDANDENDKFEFIIQANQHAREVSKQLHRLRPSATGRTLTCLPVGVFLGRHVLSPLARSRRYRRPDVARRPAPPHIHVHGRCRGQP